MINTLILFYIISGLISAYHYANYIDTELHDFQKTDIIVVVLAVLFGYFSLILTIISIIMELIGKINEK